MIPSVSIRLLQTQSDARLVAFARAGHERAFEALVRRYRGPLLGYCRRLLLSEERAEDALQQALTQAWLALRADTEVTNAKGWLYRIVHNSALNALRVSGYDYCKLSESLSGAGAPQEDLDRRIAVREALAGLAALPEMQREALLRTAVEGSSHRQTARELGLSENAVRGLVYRARATLRAAAGAIVPPPVMSWALESGGGGGPLGERLAAVGAGGSAGVAGMLAKGGAAAVTAGMLAGGITAVHAHPRHVGRHATPPQNVRQDAHVATAPIALAGVRSSTSATAVVDVRATPQHARSSPTHRSTPAVVRRERQRRRAETPAEIAPPAGRRWPQPYEQGARPGTDDRSRGEDKGGPRLLRSRAAADGLGSAVNAGGIREGGHDGGHHANGDEGPERDADDHVSASDGVEAGASTGGGRDGGGWDGGAGTGHGSEQSGETETAHPGEPSDGPGFGEPSLTTASGPSGDEQDVISRRGG